MRLIAAMLLALGLSAPAADWKSKPFTEWSQDTVLKVLTDSPWTRPKSVPLEWREREQRPITYKDIPGADGTRNPNTSLGPLGGINPPKTKNRLEDKADILVRWANALPVRHATAIYKHRESGGKDSVNGLIPAPKSGYVLEIYGLPLELGHGGTELVASLVKESAMIATRKRTIRPSKVEVLVQNTLSILVHFEPTDPITLSEQELEFSVDIKVFSVRERFRLSQMIYQGRLEI